MSDSFWVLTSVVFPDIILSASLRGDVPPLLAADASLMPSAIFFAVISYRICSPVVDLPHNRGMLGGNVNDVSYAADAPEVNVRPTSESQDDK